MTTQDGRLTQSQKRSFKRKHGLVDDITGVRYTPAEIQQLIIAHIRPVRAGGGREWDNLALLHQDTEAKINQLAYQLANGEPDMVDYYMEYLAREAINLSSLES